MINANNASLLDVAILLDNGIRDNGVLVPVKRTGEKDQYIHKAESPERTDRFFRFKTCKLTEVIRIIRKIKYPGFRQALSNDRLYALAELGKMKKLWLHMIRLEKLDLNNADAYNNKGNILEGLDRMQDAGSCKMSCVKGRKFNMMSVSLNIMLLDYI